MVDDVRHTKVLDIVEHRTEYKQRRVLRYERRKLVSHAHRLVPKITEQLSIMCDVSLYELHLHRHHAVPLLKKRDATLLLVVFSRSKQPLLLSGVRHRRKKSVAMVLDNRMLRTLAEDALIATVGRRHLLVELLFVDGQCLVGDVEVSVGSSAVPLLSKDVKTVSVAERDDVIELHKMLVRSDERLRRALADHIVARVRVVVVRLVAKHLKHLEGRRKRLGESLADGSLSDGGNATRHDAHILVNLGTDNEALARTTRHDSILVLSLQHEISILYTVDVNVLLPVVLLVVCHVSIISSA